MLYYEKDEAAKFVNIVYVVCGVYFLALAVLIFPHVGTVMDPVWSYKPMLTINILELGPQRIAALEIAQRHDLARVYRYSEWISFLFIGVSVFIGLIAGTRGNTRPVLDGFSILVSVVGVLVFYAIITNASTMLAGLSGVKTQGQASVRIEAMPLVWLFTWAMSSLAIARALAVLSHDVAVCLTDLASDDAMPSNSPISRALGNAPPKERAPRFVDSKMAQPSIDAESVLKDLGDDRVISGLRRR